MADRLAELLRQRALLQEHLAWLDAEIDAASDHAAATPPPRPAVPTRPAPSVAVQILAAATPPAPTTINPQSSFGARPSPVAEASAIGDDILDQYRASPDTLKTDVRKGCFLYFAAAFGLLGLVIVVLWLAFRR